MRISLKSKMVLTFSVVTVVIWIATIGYTFPTVAILLEEAAQHGNADQAFRIFQRNILIAGTGGTFFSIFIGYIMSVFILGPVGQVVKALKGAQKGDLTVQATCKTNDELLDLASGFNLMVENFRIFIHKTRKVASEVAEEVRKLAEQAGTAARQISEMIEQIQQDTKRAVEAMEQGTREASSGIQVVTDAGQAFDRIIKSVQDVAGRIQEVSSATQQMAAGGRQVVQNMVQIENIAAQTGGSTQEVAASIEEVAANYQGHQAMSNRLSSLSKELMDMVKHMKTED